MLCELIPLVAVLALLIGARARIVLGAHWPSDLWVAYLIGLLWISSRFPRSPGGNLIWTGVTNAGARLGRRQASNLRTLAGRHVQITPRLVEDLLRRKH